MACPERLVPSVVEGSRGAFALPFPFREGLPEPSSGLGQGDKGVRFAEMGITFSLSKLTSAFEQLGGQIL